MTNQLPAHAEATVRSSSTRTDEVRRTAAHLFGVAGYSATTMNDIAAAAGVLPGSLYHHFSSKEDIAVELLTSFGEALEQLGRASRATALGGGDAESLLRQLVSDVAVVAFDHTAAVRMRAHEAPPSVATDRFARAMQIGSPALDRAFKQSVAALAPRARLGSGDLTLLRSVLQRTAQHAPVNYLSTDLDPQRLAGHLCDLLLHGLAPECPDDAALDQSAALRAANEVIAGWRSRTITGESSDREVILAAARSEFARRGYEATTIRDIARAAGVGMGTLYRRIESKEALLRETMSAYSTQVQEAFEAALSVGSTEPETLDAVGRVFVRAGRHFREEGSIVVYGWHERESAASPFHEHFRSTLQRLTMLERLLERGVANGTLRTEATAPEMALHLRTVLWHPFHEVGRTSEARAHRFLRETVLRGALAAE
jgi:AcrR family transcriptional regulator